jgi:transposase
VGHASGGRPAERLLTHLGLPQSDDTVLRNLKHHVAERRKDTATRVVGIDDWAWQKGLRYGTIMVDLERREVVDVLPDRSAETTGRWLGQHPGIEIVSRDRCGLYANGACQGAPQAQQVADRFHLLQNPCPYKGGATNRKLVEAHRFRRSDRCRATSSLRDRSGARHP